MKRESPQNKTEEKNISRHNTWDFGRKDSGNQRWKINVGCWANRRVPGMPACPISSKPLLESQTTVVGK